MAETVVVVIGSAFVALASSSDVTQTDALTMRIPHVTLE